MFLLNRNVVVVFTILCVLSLAALFSSSPVIFSSTSSPISKDKTQNIPTKDSVDNFVESSAPQKNQKSTDSEHAVSSSNQQLKVTTNAPLFSKNDIPECAIQIFEEAKQKYLASNAKNEIVKNSKKALFTETFMVHYSPNTKRRKIISSLLSKHQNVDVSRWILEFDRQNVTESMRNCFHQSMDKFVAATSVGGDKNEKKKNKKYLRALPRNALLPIQRSVVLKHYFALYLAATHESSADTNKNKNNNDNENFLILEDDVLLRNGFSSHVQTLLDEVKSNQQTLQKVMKDSTSTSSSLSSPYDVLMIGGCLNMHANRVKKNGGIKHPAPKISQHLFFRQEARCAHAYVVSKEGARKILKSIPLTHPIDFQLNAAFSEENLKVMWVEPWLAVQGDMDGDCVTAKFYGKCPSIEVNPGREFNWTFLETAKGF